MLDLIANAKEYKKALDELSAAQKSAEAAMGKLAKVKNIERLESQASQKNEEADQVLASAMAYVEKEREAWAQAIASEREALESERTKIKGDIEESRKGLAARERSVNAREKSINELLASTAKLDEEAKVLVASNQELRERLNTKITDINSVMGRVKH